MTRSKAYAWSVVAITAGIMAVLLADPGDPRPLSTFLFWIALLVAIDLLPVSLGYGTEVMMGIPIHLAIAILFPPWISMTMAGLGAIDLRELKREIPLHRALFNRSQLMLSVGAASAVFSPFRADLLSHRLHDVAWVPLTFAIAAAAFLHVLINLSLVAGAVGFEKRVSITRAFQGLLPDPVGGFIVSYVLLTGLGVVTALARVELGAFAVAAILIPTIFARLSLLGAQTQQELSDRIRKQQQALLDATEKVFQERERERKRIAEDIHDSSLQMLAAAAYGCGNADDFLTSGQVVEARTALVLDRDAIEDAMRGLRESLVHLRKSSVEEGGLVETVRKFADQVSTVWGADVEIEGDIDNEPPIPVALAAFQILQEGLVNAVKHAESSTVAVEIRDDDGMVHIVIEDNGPGFDPAAEVGADHVGMRLMKERAARVGGRIELHTRLGSGTRLEAILPGGVAQ